MPLPGFMLMVKYIRYEHMADVRLFVLLLVINILLPYATYRSCYVILWHIYEIELG